MCGNNHWIIIQVYCNVWPQPWSEDGLAVLGDSNEKGRNWQYIRSYPLVEYLEHSAEGGLTHFIMPHLHIRDPVTTVLLPQSKQLAHNIVVQHHTLHHHTVHSLNKCLLLYTSHT